MISQVSQPTSWRKSVFQTKKRSFKPKKSGFFNWNIWVIFLLEKIEWLFWFPPAISWHQKDWGWWGALANFIACFWKKSQNIDFSFVVFLRSFFFWREQTLQKHIFFCNKTVCPIFPGIPPSSAIGLLGSIFEVLLQGLLGRWVSSSAGPRPPHRRRRCAARRAPRARPTWSEGTPRLFVCRRNTETGRGGEGGWDSPWVEPTGSVNQ